VRAVGSVPQNEGQNRTVWAARHHGGIRAAMLLPGATDGEVFRIFVERVLRPELKPGDAVVWDNLGAHQVAGVAELLQTAGVSWYYRPPYSPDDNPREEAWSKSKTWLRAALVPAPERSGSAHGRGHGRKSPRRIAGLGSNMAVIPYTNLQCALASGGDVSKQNTAPRRTCTPRPFRMRAAYSCDF
jgi:transposase